MRYGLSGAGVVAWDEATQQWLCVAPHGGAPLLEILALTSDQQLALLEHARRRQATGVAPSGLPFPLQSLRAYALWESHMVNGAKGMVRRFAPPLLRHIAKGYELVTGQVFPALKPRANFYRYPQFYMSNHRSVIPDGAALSWPAFAGVLDFELEIGVVIARETRNPSPERAVDAIGGFVVMNDWSARDMQWDDTRKGTFGGLVKAKTFAGAMSAIVVTPDEVLPRWGDIRGRVRVNGDVWCEGSTANSMYGLGDMVAYAAWGESLRAGDVLSTGTLPGCCGLELGRFPQAGDAVRLEIDGIGTLTNTIEKKHQLNMETDLHRGTFCR
ncbi:fumarylacetoacetate hydrolase family protein [Duganella sp. LX20W]|uniref:Fumarylacetoacetate hydrolase family protein n=1 Tax=Rugamonas brunnea TaxID=2758569 RepID=A0A7W2IDB0_9BURK|nr:fumarylacetoacetate hydrolase family protein [Rugamonas brunnea]MBA5639133.1 fumarylacetoacetate hydrolase family protein [Rugamonas brunnea]